MSEVLPVRTGEPLTIRSGRHYSLRMVARPLSCHWSRTTAQAGQELELCARVEAPDGTAVQFQILEHDADGQHDREATLEAKVQQGYARVRWQVPRSSDSDDVHSAKDMAAKGYSPPEFFFEVQLGAHKLASGTGDSLLRVRDRLDLEVLDRYSGKPLPGARYALTLADGSRRQGVLTANSRLVEEDLPPGLVDIKLLDEPGGMAEPLPERATPAARPIKDRGPSVLSEQASRRQGVRFHALSFDPQVVVEGEAVRLQCGLTGARPGDSLRFRLLRDGQCLAELSAPVRAGRAQARWTAALLPEGVDVLDLQFEAIFAERSQTTAAGESLRVYRAPRVRSQP